LEDQASTEPVVFQLAASRQGANGMLAQTKECCCVFQIVASIAVQLDAHPVSSSANFDTGTRSPTFTRRSRAILTRRRGGTSRRPRSTRLNLGTEDPVRSANSPSVRPGSARQRASGVGCTVLKRPPPTP